MLKPFVFKDALNLRGRSPFSIPFQIGIPPARFRAPDVDFSSGIPTVGGVPLATTNKRGQDFVINPPQGQTQQGAEKVESIASYNAGIYGDQGQFRVDLLATVPQFILKRPANTRVQLTIQNQNAIGTVQYAFDGAPSIAGSMSIAAGGNRLWDSAVPQGDLYLISSVNALVTIEFINKNLTATNT